MISGMDANQVADLMGGRPGPVPMDIAQEAAALRMAGWTPDQIADVLGDKVQRRFSNPLGAAAEMSLMSAAMGGNSLLKIDKPSVYRPGNLNIAVN